MPKSDLASNMKSSSELVSVPTDVFLDMPSRDLLLRLMEPQPHKRLRSIRTLGTIAFYKGYNLDGAKEKTIRPKDILIERFGENYNKIKESTLSFEGFDETLITE